MTTFQKLNAFTKKVADLPDSPSENMTPTQLKAQFDAAPEELRTTLNKLVDDLNTTTLWTKNTGDHKGTWQGLTPQVMGADGINAARITKLESDVTDSVNLIKQKEYLRNPKPFFGWTDRKVIEPSSSLDNNKCGEPFILWDESIAGWRMFYFGYNTSGQGYVLSATSGDLITWTKTNENLSATNLSNRHKLAILVDEIGEPVKLNNKYHGYVVSIGDNKIIYHWEADTLGGKWTETGAVISPDFAKNGTDAWNVDAPCAVYDSVNKKVVLFYMGMPSVSLSDTGIAHRANRAISDSPSSGFVYDGEVLKPSTVNGIWYYGWIGGIQLLKMSKGYLVAFNAGKNRPSAVGMEDNPSAWGFGYMDTLYSPIQPVNSPVVEIQDPLIPGYGDRVSVWRPYLVFNKEMNKYLGFYNTGDAGGQEWITFAIESSLRVSDWRGSILNITTTKQTVPNTTVKLPKGDYRIKYAYNAFSGSTPTPIDVSLKIEVNSVMAEQQQVFIGSYPYENENVLLETKTYLANNSNEVKLTAQVVSGTHTAETLLRFGTWFIESV